MIKKVVDGYWVEVGVTCSGLTALKLTIKEEERECRRIMQEIKRHIDCGSVNLRYDSHYVCSFCGSRVANKNDYECCDASIAENNN